MSRGYNLDDSHEQVLNHWRGFVETHTVPIDEASRDEGDTKVADGLYVLDAPINGIPLRLTEAGFSIDEWKAPDGTLIARTHKLTYYANHMGRCMN